MSCIKNFVDKIEEEITVDLNNFEPIDNEGWEMEGSVVYKGKEHNVYLNARFEDSLERQAALSIADDLLKS